jgi:hypothetical protein
MEVNVSDKLNVLLAEYRNLIESGSTVVEALEELDYLHPITLSRLKKLIDGQPRHVAESPKKEVHHGLGQRGKKIIR